MGTLHKRRLWGCIENGTTWDDRRLSSSRTCSPQAFLFCYFLEGSFTNFLFGWGDLFPLLLICATKIERELRSVVYVTIMLV